MKRKSITLFLILFLLSSCENVFVNSSDSTSNLTSSTIYNSQSESNLENHDRDYYRSLIDRDAIHYSESLENDVNYEVNSLRIFQINDTHGAYYDDSSTIGIARVATAMKELTLSPYATVKIANGDLMQGSAFSNLLLGEPAIASLNECGFDAFVLGNHEFDWGIDALQIYKDHDLSNGELNCPILGANILNQDNVLPSWIEPYTIVEKGNLKVGIIGVIGDGQENSIAQSALNGYHFADTIEIVNQYCAILEPLTDIIIVASHAHNEFINAAYVSNQNRIDAIINAHDHRLISETVTRNLDNFIVPVVESDDKNDSIGYIDLSIDKKRYDGHYSIEHVNPKSYALDANLKAIMDVYYKAMENYLNTTLKAYTPYLSKQELGCLAAEVMVENYDVDFAFTNRAGIRAFISTGPLKVSSVYEVFPFDNCVATTMMKGNDIINYFNANGNNYYYSRNNTIGMNGTQINFSLIDANKDYKVATFDFVATNYMSDFFQGEKAIFTDVILRDLMIEYFKNL